jgi:hypothetical protein
MEGIDRTDLDAIGVLALDAVVDDDESHEVNSAVGRGRWNALLKNDADPRQSTPKGSRGVRQRALLKSAAMDGRF